MALSCSCDYDDDKEPGMWLYWFGKDDFELLDTSKRKRCCSCNVLIDKGALCVKHPRFRYPYNEIEAKINGDINFEMAYEPPIKIADHYHCEKCGEIWLNLTALGYDCLSPSENMPDSLTEYQELIGFTKEGKES